MAAAMGCRKRRKALDGEMMPANSA